MGQRPDAAPSATTHDQGVNNGSEAVMQEWLRNQQWGAELWVAAAVVAIVLLDLLLRGYDHYFKR
jgi:hypothetical protein